MQERRRLLIAVAGNITNLAFDLVPAAEASGIALQLFIVDDPPTPPELREAIFRGLKGRVRLIGASRIAVAARILGIWAAARRAGLRPLLLFPGASHPASVAGNAAGLIELASQVIAGGDPWPRRIYVSLATGNTVAGFLLAADALEQAGYPPLTLVGVQVYPGRGAQRAWAQRAWAAGRLKLRAPRRTRLEVKQLSGDGGFGAYPPSLPLLCERVAREGLALDPIFGGKSWDTMEKDLAGGQTEAATTIYWHCGFTPEWRIVGRPQS
jgi:1-aminocyclopropane-1-carboxylate deaminase/D-cysteine desulfhydrase-like pyridoxal-dependent ACC family enzyme